MIAKLMRWWAGFDERDVRSLANKLESMADVNGGFIVITKREYRALRANMVRVLKDGRLVR